MKRLRLPTYEDAKKLVQEKGELVFYESIRYIDTDFKISVFNYRLPQYSDFIHDEIDYREMRGLTFVFNKDGSLYKRFLLMKKFWNVNQVPESMYHVIKDYTQKSCYNKEDGSLISFIQLPNGKVVTKTKMGFDNEQTIDAENIYNTNSAIKEFVNWCLDNDIVSMWEFVSFKNRIVLNYDKANLILLRLRDNKTGDYLDIEEYRDKGFAIAEQENYTLDEFIELSETLTDKEGCVFTMTDEFGNFWTFKQKTQWYFNLHRLISDLELENTVIKLILDDKIDDTKSTLDINSHKMIFITDIEEKLNIFIKNTYLEIKKLLSDYENHNKKSFALKYRKHKFFGMIMYIINKDADIYEVIKKHILKETSKLQKAREFLDLIE